MLIKTAAVGTSSDLGRGAVVSAFTALGRPSVDVLSYEFQSKCKAPLIGKEDIKRGAQNKVRDTLKILPSSDVSIGIESGLVREDGAHWFEIACIAVETKDGRSSFAFGAQFPIPPWIVKHTDDRIEHLSQGEVNSSDMLIPAIKCALAPILNKGRYSDP